MYYFGKKVFAKNLIKRNKQWKILKMNSGPTTWSSYGESIYIVAQKEQKVFRTNAYFQMHFSGRKLKDPIERYVNYIIVPCATINNCRADLSKILEFNTRYLKL